jgi:hypothetical protein
VVVAYQKDYTVMVAIVTVESPHTILFEHEGSLIHIILTFFFYDTAYLVYRGFEYNMVGKSFVYFESDQFCLGFLFAVDDEASTFSKKAKKIAPIKQKKSKDKNDFVIGDVISFKKDIGFTGGSDNIEGIFKYVYFFIY